MWIHPRSATLVAVFSFICLCFAAPASATDGGTSIADAAAAEAASTAADPIQTQTVKLTRNQTKSVQRRVKVKPDGALGTGTRRAIKRHQRAKRLTLTGSPNVETLRSLGLKVADKIEARLRAEQSGGAGVDTTPISAPSSFAAAAITAAREAIGTPYKWGGNTLSGFDCSGLTVWAFKRAGVTLPRTSFSQYTLGETVKKAEIQPGDLVFFDSAGAGASHVGVATSPTTVISATSRGVKDHTFASGYWAGHYVGARRVDAAAVKAATRR